MFGAILAGWSIAVFAKVGCGIFVARVAGSHSILADCTKQGVVAFYAGGKLTVGAGG